MMTASSPAMKTSSAFVVSMSVVSMNGAMTGAAGFGWGGEEGEREKGEEQGFHAAARSR